MALLHCAVRTTMIFQLVLAFYFLDIAYSISDPTSTVSLAVSPTTTQHVDPTSTVSLAVSPTTTQHVDTGGAATVGTGGGATAVGGSEIPVGHDCAYNASRAQGNCVENAECPAPSGNKCVCAPGFHNESGHCKLLAGQTCRNNDSCIANASCELAAAQPDTTRLTTAVKVCTCLPAHYQTNESLCAARIDLTHHCDPLESGLSPCKQPEYTACHNKTCVCNEYYFYTGKGSNDCSHRVLVDHNCEISPDNCVLHAKCNVSFNNTCKCDPGYYKNDSLHCQKRLAPGASCSITSLGDDPCTEGGNCHRGTCVCNPYLYKPSEDNCIPVVHIGEKCDAGNFCPENAHCSNTVCICDNDYFHDTILRVCRQRKSAGSGCTSSHECVANGGCVNNVCVCDMHYYNHNHRCNHRVELTHACDALIPDQCLLNGECVRGHCQCNNRSYVNERTNCPLTLHFGTSCNWENHDPRQCESNTSCIFRPKDSMPVCGCDISHFFNGKYCVKRALAGESCPYDTEHSLGLNITREEFDKQCVENAECTPSSFVCECTTGFYDRDGRCPQRIQPGNPCDPWTDYQNQCVDGYMCKYGQCVPSDDSV